MGISVSISHRFDRKLSSTLTKGSTMGKLNKVTMKYSSTRQMDGGGGETRVMSGFTELGLIRKLSTENLLTCLQCLVDDFRGTLLCRKI